MKPCAQALIDAGVARVVTAMEDPDPRTAGQGHAMLEKAGIAVTTGVLAEEAARAHSGHVARIKKGRPHVTLKLAMSADGMIGTRVGDRMIITGMPAFDAVQAMRTTFDVVLVGIGTVLADDPSLTVPAAGARTALARPRHRRCRPHGCRSTRAWCCRRRRRRWSRWSARRRRRRTSRRWTVPASS